MKACPAHQAQPGPGEEALVCPSPGPPPSPHSSGRQPRRSHSGLQQFPKDPSGGVGDCLGPRLPGPPPPRASHLLELLGFDLHLLLQGRVGAPELHGLLVAEQHLLLHFPFTAFLGRGRAQGLSGPACPREGQGSLGNKLTLPITGSGSTVATDTGKEKKASHGPWPLLLPIVSGASLNLLLSSCSHVCAIHCPLGMETPARRAGPFQEYQAKIDSHQ